MKALLKAGGGAAAAGGAGGRGRGRGAASQEEVASRDGEGTLLDHAVIYFGAGMSNGNAHDRTTRLPFY